MMQSKILSLIACVFTLSCIVTQANANAVIGFDLGSAFFKISLNVPGKTFQIVENVTSARKTENMMTVTPEQRLFSKDSFNGMARYPTTTFSHQA
jgi:molecular chaperone DnaK (HSP70)